MMRALLMLSWLGCSGCSFLFVRPAPPDHEQRRDLECTSSRLAPIVDVAGAAESVAIAVAVEALSNVSLSGEPHGVTTDGRVVEVAAVGLAAVQLASAAYGFRKTSECDRAEELWRVRIARPPARPGCADDAGCKAGRRCVQGLCVWPPVAQ